MHIRSLTVAGFRCFGPDPVTVELDPLTALIGANGSGKTAVMAALLKLFGASPRQRQIERSDFHVEVGDALHEGQVLSIEAQFVIPADDPARSLADAALLRCYAPESDGKALEGRIRLDAVWHDSDTPDGEPEARTRWLQKTDTEFEPGEDLRASDRRIVRVVYLPAVREPLVELRSASSSMLSRLFATLHVAQEARSRIEKAFATASDAFGALPGLAHVRSTMESAWRRLSKDPHLTDLQLRATAVTVNDLLRRIEAEFSTPGGRATRPENLSEGQKSLLFFSMALAAYEVERELAAHHEAAPLHGLDAAKFDAHLLTIFAVEEPENHLAPHYLGRVLGSFSDAHSTGMAQVIVSSHAPAVLARVKPNEVRHLRLDATGKASATKVVLPAGEADAFKYVKEAVRAYPELYFSDAVVLCEGDSEQVVLPYIARWRETDLDKRFVSVVPLGGRHVTHFWRLLHGLGVPHVTLLDLDRERQFGGWARIQSTINEIAVARGEGATPQTVVDELCERHADLEVLEGDMRKWSTKEEAQMCLWAEALEDYGVFYSAPLDVDLLMYQAFREQYRSAHGSVPAEVPEEEEKAEAFHGQLLATVLGKPSTATFGDVLDDLRWYRHLFLVKGKPVTHRLALATMESPQMAQVPPVLTRLLDTVQAKLDAGI